MKVIDGKNTAMGRIASYSAKQALQGEEIAVVNCDEIRITGNKKSIEADFKEQRSRVGSSQKGPKHHKTSEKIVKRVIRGMLPDHRRGRGREAFKRIKCYSKVPKELEESEKMSLARPMKGKFIIVKEVAK